MDSGESNQIGVGDLFVANDTFVGDETIVQIVVSELMGGEGGDSGE